MASAFSDQFTTILYITWDSEDRLFNEVFVTESLDEIHKLIEAGKADEYAEFPDDLTVGRAFIDTETANAWTEFLRALGSRYGYNIVEAKIL